MSFLEFKAFILSFPQLVSVIKELTDELKQLRNNRIESLKIELQKEINVKIEGLKHANNNQEIIDAFDDLAKFLNDRLSK